MRNIILIGMSLSGKTTLAYEISKKLNCNFIDTDKLIEEENKITINEIFKVKGEKFFRDLESSVIEKIKYVDNSIISTGGGMPIYNKNIDKLKNIGIVVYLRVPLEILLKRAKNVENRPLIKGNYKDKVKNIYNSRFKVYESADIIIDLGNNLEENLDNIINVIEKLNK